ncbi:leucine-rich repeat domain-containing protein [Cellvibrio japonicus]|uniref:Internalin E n=1 Tax=Cellvibrio japonicus (strain Ueda107) TaxID=498211 RepID=B3PC13_CELJU|nr:leucine-rich repeat domain-containing protein [Cellvibrio japonicus]ACE85787.1 internalin E [Cellvibrio japonicus Ueda107]QEI13168.1 leucine-rich repeat domain-containing protein [Cellvibrio japonicus]QEI16742.1 leucine-rich repeat domain-containing protein [Cellvibrio japonicus]QEI20320.1 leucine-rich repeat domain-containing protein [Cellvibrio japonicus]
MNTVFHKPCWLLLVLVLGITGCQKYSVSLNDKVIYTPPGLFKDYQITDELLAGCVEQTISDKQITQIEQLTQLNCSNAGIRSLAGLEKFYALSELNLAYNQLTDVTTLGKLARLQRLVLTGNPIEDATALLPLVNLQELNLAEVSRLRCASLDQLKRNLAEQKAKVIWPGHCDS